MLKHLTPPRHATTQGPVGTVGLGIAAAVITLALVTLVKLTGITQETLTVRPQKLTLTGHSMEELTITNQADVMQAIYVELAPNDGKDCDVRYTPKHLRIAPGETQIVYLLLEADSAQICNADILLVVTESLEFPTDQSPAKETTADSK